MTGVKIVELRGFTSPCFGAKCACGAWLTKWDWSADDARSVAEQEIILGRHRCRQTQNRQLTLEAAK